MQRIKTMAVKLTEGMRITYPLSGDSGKLSLPFGNKKTYNMNGGRFVFIDEFGDVYAIPAIDGVKGHLVASDYVRDLNLEVPFSSREAYPSDYKSKWLMLIAEMRSPS